MAKLPKLAGNSACMACGETLTVTHWSLYAMAKNKGPVLGECRNGCDEHEQTAAYAEYCIRHNLEYDTGKPCQDQ